MTKKLTDKWRAGNLKKSFYYLKFPDTETAEIYNLYDMEKFRYVQDSEKIDVLDEVPSYDEYQKLQKKLEIATKALEYYAQCKHLNLDILAMVLEKHKNEFADFEVYEDGEHARQALKEMKGVK